MRALPVLANRHLSRLNLDPISIDKYRFMMCPEVWCFATEAICATRNYDIGLDIGILLLQCTIQFQTRLDEHELDRSLHIISIFILDMLDRSDRWEEYLDWFNFLKKNCTLNIRENKNWLRNDPETLAYIVGRDGNDVLLKYMYQYHPRMKTIERKIARLRRGRSTGNVRHPQKDELTPEEIRHRLDKVIELFRFKQTATAYWQQYWAGENNEDSSPKPGNHPFKTPQGQNLTGGEISPII